MSLRRLRRGSAVGPSRGAGQDRGRDWHGLDEGRVEAAPRVRWRWRWSGSRPAVRTANPAPFRDHRVLRWAGWRTARRRDRTGRVARLRGAEVLHRPQIGLGVELPQGVLALVAHGAEDLAPGPGAVVQAVNPGAVGEGIPVAAVEEVAIVEAQRPGEALLGGGGPFEDLLAPVHAQVVVHVAGLPHLGLGGVPVAVMGAALGELGLRISLRARVAGVLGQGLAGPVGGRARRNRSPPCRRRGSSRARAAR